MSRKRRKAGLGLLALTLLTGCWSSAAIEDLNLQVGLALDSGERTESEKRLIQEGGSVPEPDLVDSTYQFLLLQSSKKSGTSGNSVTSYYNATESGESLIRNVRELALRSARQPIAHHLKVIVIGERLARKLSLSDLIDFFSRDNDIRPSVIFAVSRGRARDVFERALPGEIPAFVLVDTFDNRNRTNRIWEPVSLGKITGPLHTKQSFLLQAVAPGNKENKFAGAAVIEGATGKLRGFLNEEELEGAVWLTGRGKGGVVQTTDPKSGNMISYEIKFMKSKIVAAVQGEEVSFHVKMESDGRLAESFLAGEEYNEALLEREKVAFEAKVRALAKATLTKLQREYRVDALGFGDYMRIQHPAVWRKIKGDWDERFSRAKVTYEVRLNIEEYGATKRDID
ncbi:Ger(x)C family spore germination protein [Paenibacillus sp. CN-4]|uniref:Ger(x)C family spore germination protein n=1 Tax=Paenibacillus nanchangensis TaxID=3348343 RepID=UPI00397B9E03